MAAKGLRAQWLGVLLVLAAGTAVLALALAEPAGAQGGFFDGFFRPFPSNRPAASAPERAADFSRAPAPKKAETPPTTTILVLGDSMADWLAYGLEDALSETPEIGVVRKNRAYSGLIRYDSRSDTQDWSGVARESIATEKPNFIVMMLGLNDRQTIRERVAAPPAKGAAPAPAATPAQQPNADAEKSDSDQSDQPAAIAAPESPVRGRVAGVQEFRTDKWAELYGKRIDDTIAALKSRGVPVYWVGLPAVRGAKSTSEMQYLNDMFRARAEKAGISYIDVWDGFVDDQGRFTLQGPDFEGQIRRLRAGDGVHFTKAGARKLAHYVEREIRRSLDHGPVAVALPSSEPLAPALAGGKSDGATPRPLAGPVMPLTAATNASDSLLGGANTPDAPGHILATRVLANGETVLPPAGRSDDFAWPRRAPAPLGADPVVATTTLPLPVMQPPPSQTKVVAPSVSAPAVPGAGGPRVAQQRPPKDAPPPPRQQGFQFPFFSLFR